ncbi:MAG TPA: Spy/CpxP family protein refolding chaperone [Burkholderiales bacterium]|nr:Spy/CpxP family protein refolding chaperone [Burkholderiales bacterium]
METRTEGCARRGFFRRAGLFALAGTALAGFGAKAYAQGGWHRGEPLSEAHLDRMLKHLYVEIDATEEQKQRLAPILKDAAKDLAPLREKARATRAQAIELLTQDRIDPAAIESLRAEKMRLADEASRRFTKALSDAAEVLTPEQRKTLAQRFERHRHRWG